jgi:hypothetical protein
MMKAQVAPRLRALGFKGSGQSYELPSPGYWAMIGFQKSSFSDAKSVRFTVNVLVVSRTAWATRRETHAWLPAKPTANTGWGHFPSIWQRRLGELLPARQDMWWDIAAGIATERLAETIIGAITDYALPAMKDQMRA